ncbi:MAG TPA: hypothetical protein VMQ93_08585 [Novosphingobium sp.]|nr:hypothetical protein [Novosphingobium sp.]
MKHDFTPDPETGRAGHSAPPNWIPEMLAIVGIFLAVWIAFALHFLSLGV